jgi:triacylglycerol esterase/lipase EstA (alpha/beta hydrolase family)
MEIQSPRDANVQKFPVKARQAGDSQPALPRDQFASVPEDEVGLDIKSFKIFHDKMMSTVTVDEHNQVQIATVEMGEAQPLGKDPPMTVSRLSGKKWVKDSQDWSGKKIALLVHGFNHSSEKLLALANHLQENHDFDAIYGVDYKLGYRIDDLGRKLAGVVNEKAGEDASIKIFAHSMGGLISRSAIENHGLAGKTSTLITMGTPHNGVNAAFVANDAFSGNLPEVEDLTPKSPFLKKLNDGKPVDVSYYAAVGVEGKNLTKYWTINFLGQDGVNQLLGDPRNDGMVPARSAGHDLSGECSKWESKTFPVNHKFIRGGQLGKQTYPELFQQIDQWLGS